MKPRLQAMAVLLLGGAGALLAPYAGAALAARLTTVHFQFPPRFGPVAQPGLSEPVFVILGAGLLALGLALVATMVRAPGQRLQRPVQGFPVWGWLALVWVGLWWWLAWTRYPWFEPFQRYTYTPLWLGYIVAVNALSWRRSGRSLLTHHPGLLLALLALSVPFWWMFEMLNGFGRNWYYVHTTALSDDLYAVSASTGFATVLPAVASTAYWLADFPRVSAPAIPAVRLRAGWFWAGAALAGGLMAGAAFGAWPEQLFPLLWLAPGLVWLGLDGLSGGRPLTVSVSRGDWGPLLVPAVAALVCGLVWELWNAGSFAQWRYALPYVDAYELFEMPLLGYAGYLPFGIVCALVVDLVSRAVAARPLRFSSPASAAE